VLALGVAAVVAAVGVGLRYYDHVQDHRRREDGRVAALRLESADTLFKGQDARARRDWDNGRLILSQLLTKIEAEPRLADLRAKASDLLKQIERGLADQRAWEADRDRFDRFIRRRNEAFYSDTMFTRLDVPGNLEATRASARAALDVFAAGDHGDAWALAPLPAALSPQEQADVAEDCAELLLVLAEAVAQPLPGEDHRRQADQGLRILDQAARLHSPTRAYHLRRAACLEWKGDAAGATRERQDADRLPPAGALDHFLSGQERSKRRDWAAAIPHFEATLKLRPDHFWAQCLLGIGYMQTRRPTEARLTLTDCIRRQPGLVWLYLLRGYANGVEGQFKQAQAKLVPAAAAAPEAEATARFEDAEADFRRALELSQNDEDRYTLLVNRGTVRFLRLQLADAAADLQEAIRLKPREYQAYATLAQVEQHRGELDEAVARFTRAIALRPDWSPLYRGRADVHRERKDPSRALLDLEEAIRREAPGSPVIARDHARRAQLLYLDRRFEEALAACDAALTIVPDQAEAHRWRIRALLELRRFDEVIGSCDVSLTTGEPSADLHELRGLARVGRDDFAGAIEDYTRSLTLEPGTPRVHVHRGWAYLFANAPELALRDFEEAVRLDPENRDAYNGRGSARVRLGRHREGVADAEAAIRHGGEPTKSGAIRRRPHLRPGRRRRGRRGRPPRARGPDGRLPLCRSRPGASAPGAGTAPGRGAGGVLAGRRPGRPRPAGAAPPSPVRRVGGAIRPIAPVSLPR
jgi:tetratricopeptide (TPR) repeat protein